MFTGIVEELGKVLEIKQYSITVECGTVLKDTNVGDSIAVNGVCLTVVDLSTKSFTADLSPETLKITSLKTIATGSLVNLERAMPANGRFGGHIVSGHVDGLGEICSIKNVGNFYELKIKLNPNEAKYSIKKGLGSPVFLLYAVKECHHQSYPFLASGPLSI